MTISLVGAYGYTPYLAIPGEAMSFIVAHNLTKTFRVARHQRGLLGAFKKFLSRDEMVIEAVSNLSFKIERGELVGYIGPNGAGKSTTIKMLTGILVPSGGDLTVGGIVPYERRVEHVRRIGVVFGQRTQLWWDLPVIESLELLKRIYRVPEQRYRENLERFSKLLDLHDFLNIPVRNLSLGQRMRSDLAAALLHDPEVLFLDEPTIGLDVEAKQKIRTFIQELNRERQVTILLTTHDLSDIEKLCERVMIIDHGALIFDGTLTEIRNLFGKIRTVVVDFREPCGELSLPGSATAHIEDGRAWIRFNRDAISASEIIYFLTSRYEIADLAIEEPEIEEIVRTIYREGINIQKTDLG